jgi:hypothetical protein
MSELIWDNPPAAGGPGIGAHARRWYEIAGELKKRPGDWAIVRSGDLTEHFSAHTTAGNIRRGLLTAFRPVGAFEAVARKVDDEVRVYARYVGVPSET